MNKLQGTIEKIRDIIQSIGPATARQIETHPEVVAACRSSKAKARRLIERLLSLGSIQSDGSPMQPKYSIASAAEEWERPRPVRIPLNREIETIKLGWDVL